MSFRFIAAKLMEQSLPNLIWAHAKPQVCSRWTSLVFVTSLFWMIASQISKIIKAYQSCLKIYPYTTRKLSNCSHAATHLAYSSSIALPFEPCFVPWLRILSKIFPLLSLCIDLVQWELTHTTITQIARTNENESSQFILN